MSVPNLDCETLEGLKAFGTTFGMGRNRIREARNLFPRRPKGYVRAARDLGNYAQNKYVAVLLRLQGNISGATLYEVYCDRIYSRLPTWARW